RRAADAPRADAGRLRAPSRGSRDAVRLLDAATTVEQAQQGRDHWPIEVGSRLLAQDAPRFLDGPAFPIDALHQQRVVGVGNRENPGSQRNGLAGQLAEIALAINALVVGGDNLRLPAKLDHT